MWIIKLGLIWTVFAFTSPEAESAKACYLPSRAIGVCKRLMDCPEAFMAWTENREYPNICDSEKGKELICCDSPREVMPEKQQRTRPRPKQPQTSRTSGIVGQNKASTPSFGRKSREKCREYARAVRRFSGTRKGCTAPTFTKKNFESKKAAKTDFPYTVQVGFDGPQRVSWDCGGTLISDRYVLTAAHCLQNIYSTPATLVRWLRNDTDPYLQLNVVERIAHPDYEPVGQYNDIALLRLEERIKDFDNYIRPACLHADEEKHSNAIATGWGRTRVGNSILEDLLVAGLPILSHNECSKQFKKGRPDLYRGVDEKVQFCAGGNSYAKTLCLGDYGGPLVVPTKECMFKLIGITSFGSRCKRPGIYVRISHFVPWIESIVWADD